MEGEKMQIDYYAYHSGMNSWNAGLKVYLRYLLVPIGFLLTSCFVIAVQFSGSAYGEWNLSLHFFYLCITKSSLAMAIRVFFQVLAGISTLYMLSFLHLYQN